MIVLNGYALSKGIHLKLHLLGPSTENLCTGYGTGFVAINRQRIETSCVVLPEQIIEPWDASRFEALSESHFTFLANLGMELVLLGTGAVQRFPDPRLLRPLIEARIGFEIMDTPAACRTYNILVGEGRKVAAALLL
jgi:uncharacterized protein